MKFDKVFKEISNFFKKLTPRDFIYAVVILFLMGICVTSIQKCSDNEAKYRNNIEALTDSVTYYRAKDGNMVAMKTAFTAEANELKQLNKELYDKIKGLNVKPSTITNTVYLKGETEFLPQDTAYVVHHDTIAKGVDKKFNFNNEWRDLEGNVSYHDDTLGVHITKDLVRFDYTVAMDKNNKIYIKSDNPYVTVNEIEGFQIPKKKQKHWGVGPNVSMSWDPINKKFVPTIGIGVQWSPITF